MVASVSLTSSWCSNRLIFVDWYCNLPPGFQDSVTSYVLERACLVEVCGHKGAREMPKAVWKSQRAQGGTCPTCGNISKGRGLWFPILANLSRVEGADFKGLETSARINVAYFQPLEISAIGTAGSQILGNHVFWAARFSIWWGGVVSHYVFEML